MTEQFPLIIENDRGLLSLPDTLEWISSSVAELKSSLDNTGAILFRGFPVHSAEDFDAFTGVFEYEDFTYAESLSNAVRINHTPRVFTANEAPPDIEIYLHHEMAQTPISPDRIFFFCQSAADEGGATPLCRSDYLYDALNEAHPEWTRQFESLGLKYTTHMPAADDPASGQGRSWQSTLSVDGKESAEKRLRSLGYSWEWRPDDSLKATSPALPAVKRLPDGRQSFYNQVIAAYRGWKRSRESPDEILTFGNGKSIPTEILDTIVELSSAFIYPLYWKDGDVAMVDNHRVMHGRHPYGGDRKRQVLVCLARE